MRCDKQHIWNRAPLFDLIGPARSSASTNRVSFVEISAVGTFAALSSITLCHESMGVLGGQRAHGRVSGWRINKRREESRFPKALMIHR